MKGLAWLAPDGKEMDDAAWNADFVRSLGMLLSGHSIEEVSERGEPLTGDTLLVLLNAHSDKVPFTLPSLDPDQQWRRIADTFDPQSPERLFKPGARYPLQGRSVVVFRMTAQLRVRRRASDEERAAMAQPTSLADEPVGVDG